MTSSNESAIVAELNRKRFHELLPVLVYMSVMAAVGIIGNTIVIFVYRMRFAMFSSSNFIVAFAMLHMTGWIFGMSLDIVEMTLQYGLQHPMICKLSRFVTCFTFITSGVILIAAAYDRYTVFKPYVQISAKMPKVLITVAVLIGLAFSWPALVIFGNRDVYIPEYNLTTDECSVEAHLAGTIYPMLYSAVLGGVFCLFTAFLVAIYSCFRGQLRKENKRTSTALEMQNSPGTTITPSFRRYDSANVNTITRTDTSGRKNDIRKRTTTIFFAISCVFMLSYLPCLILLILRSTITDFEKFSSRAADVSSQLFLRSYFINNAVYPIVYWNLDPQYHKICRRILVEMLCAVLCPCCIFYTHSTYGKSPLG